jgi:hypothetical protein
MSANGHDPLVSELWIVRTALKRQLRYVNTQLAQARRDRVAAAIQEWAAIFGEPPCCDDWNATKARLSPGGWRAVRRAATGRDWPSARLVTKAFGSWNAGIAAAGFVPRPAGWAANGVVHHHCRRCCCFVSHPYATCRACGHDHGCDWPALEEPIRTRRPRARTIPIRKVRR